jgi:hypothetical protein
MYLFYFMLQVITLMIDDAKEQILIEFQTSSLGLPHRPSLSVILGLES